MTSKSAQRRVASQYSATSAHGEPPAQPSSMPVSGPQPLPQGSNGWAAGAQTRSAAPPSDSGSQLKLAQSTAALHDSPTARAQRTPDASVPASQSWPSEQRAAHGSGKHVPHTPEHTPLWHASSNTQVPPLGVRPEGRQSSGRYATDELHEGGYWHDSNACSLKTTFGSDATSSHKIVDRATH